MKKYKVKLPLWWSDGKEITGYTDKVDTYCCCLCPSWFVEVIEFDYQGYFNSKDLTLIQE